MATPDATPCEDGDPCTDDTCDTAACAGQTLPGSIHRRFEATGRRVVRAQTAGSPARTRRLLWRAIKALRKAATTAMNAGRRLTISNDCATATADTLTELRTRLDSLLATLGAARH